MRDGMSHESCGLSEKCIGIPFLLKTLSDKRDGFWALA